MTACPCMSFMCLSRFVLSRNGSLLVPQISHANFDFRGVEEDAGDEGGRNFDHLLTAEGEGEGPEGVGDEDPSELEPSFELDVGLLEGEDLVDGEDEVEAGDSTVFSEVKPRDFSTR